MMKKYLSYFLFLPFLWPFTGLLAYDSDKHFVVACIIAFVTSIVLTSKATVLHNLKSYPIYSIIILSSIVAIITKIYVGQSTSILRVLIATSLLVFLPQDNVVKFVKTYLAYLVPLASLISIAYVMHQSYYLQLDRVEWSINPIPYTTMVAAISTINFYYIVSPYNFKIKIANTVGFFLSVTGILISETRGTLVALIAALLILFLFRLDFSTLKHKGIKYLTIASIAILTLFFVNKDTIKPRYERTVFEVQQILNGNYSTSIGLRLHMWQAGLELAKHPTLIGLGDSHIAEKKKLAEKNLIHQSAVKWRHYHNDYITSWVKRGVVGFVFLLVMLSFPFYYFMRYRSEETTIASLVGVIYVVGSFTDIPLSQANSLILYLILMIVLCSPKRTEIQRQ